MKRLTFAIAVAGTVAACAQTPAQFQVPPPHVSGKPAASSESSEQQPSGQPTAPGAQNSTGPSDQMVRLAPPPRVSASVQQLDWSVKFSNADSVSVAVDAIPLRDFINYALGEVLKANYVISEGLPGMDDPVTLRLDKPITSRAFYKLVVELLDSRGIGTTYKDGVFYLHPADGKARGSIPIGFGRRAEDVPDVPGLVLQIIPLRYGVSVTIERTVTDLVSVDVKADQAQGALFVTGDRQAILRVIDVVNLLDQPANRARDVAIVKLDYVGGKEAADELVTLLGNEGILAGVGGAEGKNVGLVPLDRLGALVVFASSAELMGRVEYWVRQLDKPNQGPDQRYFIYHPRNARASDLGQSLAPLLGGAMPSAGDQARDTRSALGAAGPGQDRSSVQAGGQSAQSTGQFVTQENVMRRDTGLRGSGSQSVAVQGEGLTMSVDPRSNSLIFFTTGQRYQTLLPMIRQLDVPPKQILLETMVAEVTLTGEFAYGVEFAFTEGKFSGGTLGGLGLPDGGLALSYIDSITQQIRMKLTATNGLVNVLSNPTLIVRDGAEATIMVGNDVPTVGATASDPITSERQITQVLYRQTGLQLRIMPTINAEGLVVMEIEQQISNQQPGAASVEGAPTFFQRAVSTEVVARSGQSILLAGLVADRQTRNSSKVPGFGDVPGLGWLFRSENKSNEKTELVVLITPRVIDDPSEWSQIRVGMQTAFTHLKLPESTAAATPPPSQAACTDSDRDGVCDASDRCPRTLPSAAVDGAGCEVGEVELGGIAFRNGTAELTASDEALLAGVVDLLRTRPAARADIRAYAYGRPHHEGNVRLSQERADAVRAYVVSTGVGIDRLTARGMGDARAGADPAGLAGEDRVTVEIFTP